MTFIVEYDNDDVDIRWFDFSGDDVFIEKFKRNLDEHN